MSKLVTAETFADEVLSSTVPVLVDFYADWCAPCRAFAPMLDEVEQSLGDAVKVVKVDIDDQQALAVAHQVMSIPTIKVFRAGKETGRVSGPQSKADILALLD